MSQDATPELEFTPLFDLRGGEPDPPSAEEAVAQPDSRAGRVYRMSKELHFAVEVALTTGRPLLLRGDPGTGKSSLAAYLARRLGWRYYEQVVTSTSTAGELQWRFDAVARLADAQSDSLEDDLHYVEPGVLWWAMNRTSALDRGKEPNASDNATRDPHRAVVLIDEIDKAHPDLPNGLLVALGSNQIAVPQLDEPVRLTSTGLPPLPQKLPRGVEVSPVLLVITTNEERELPGAFLRRCVIYKLEHPGATQLVEIARAHFHTRTQRFLKRHERLARAVARRVEDLRAQAGQGDHKPSTAEFLDAFRACRNRGIAPKPEDPRWQLIERLALTKPARMEE